MISTRGRYAIRVLIDLAEHRGEAFTPMKEVGSNSKKLALCLLKNSTHQRLVSNFSLHLVRDSKAKN